MDFGLITNSLKKGFEVWKDNIVAYVVGLIIFAVILLVINGIGGALGGASLITSIMAGTFTGLGMAALVMIVVLIVDLLVLLPLLFGLVYMVVKGVRGQKVEITDLFYAFKSKSAYIRSLIYGIVYAIIFGILGIIPIIGWLVALIVEIALIYAIYIYIMTPSENIVYAFKESFNVVKENLVETIVAFVVFFLLVFIGILLLGIGLLLTLPVAMAFVVILLKELKPSQKDESDLAI